MKQFVFETEMVKKELEKLLILVMKPLLFRFLVLPLVLIWNLLLLSF